MATTAIVAPAVARSIRSLRSGRQATKAAKKAGLVRKMLVPTALGRARGHALSNRPRVVVVTHSGSPLVPRRRR